MIWWIILVAIVLLFGFVVFFGAPYVPSQKRYVKRAFRSLYKVGPDDVLVDVGSGDGMVLRIAAMQGAVAIGYELNPILVGLSLVLSARYPKVSVRLANFWHIELPDNTTVVYAFAVSRDGEKLVKKLKAEADRLGRPLKLICYASPLKSIKADKTFEAYYLYTFRPLQPSKAQV